MRLSPILLGASTMLLASCGHQTALAPPPGHPMPVKPMMARATPTFKELLTPPTQARPTRVDELVTRSRPRPADPFDLPPPTGGEAPPGPAGTDPAPLPANSITPPPGE